MVRAYFILSILALASSAGAANKKRPLVLVCYDGGSSARTESCDYIRDYVNDPKKCDDAEVVEVDPRNPTPGQIKEFLTKKKLPANALTIVSGHEATKEDEPEIHRFSLGRRDSVKTTDVLEALGGAKGGLASPSIWLSVCGAAGGCAKGYCVGGTCQKDELTTSLPDTKYTDLATVNLLKLFCKKADFDAAGDKRAVLAGAAFGEFLRCQPEALDFDAFSMKGDDLEKRYEAKKKEQRDTLVRILNGAFLDEVIGAHLTKTGQKTTIEYKLGDRYSKAYAERARDAYAAYVAAGGLPDRVAKAKKITDAIDAKQGPSDRGYITAEDPAFKALWDKVKYSEPKVNGDYTEYRMTYPWKPLRPCVRGEGTRSKFSFRPHLDNFSFRFYPDASYEPKKDDAPAPKEKASTGNGRTH